MLHPVKIEIDSAATERISTAAVAHCHPNAADYVDANWVRCLHCGTFTVPSLTPRRHEPY